MENKGRSRLMEWGKNLLILLLLLSAVYLLSHTQLADRVTDSAQRWLGGDEEQTQSLSTKTSSATVHLARVAVCQDGLRYGVQYDQEGTDAVFESVSTLLSEAVVSATEPETVSERTWRSALCSTGVYLDFLYAIPMSALSGRLADGRSNELLTGTARRICLAADRDGGVSLFYINEEDGSYYTCGTTLSRDFHLDEVVAQWAPNGAMFAFEVEGMDATGPYTLLTARLEPLIYTAANPLLEDNSRLTQLLNVLDFTAQRDALDLTSGFSLVEGSDSLRLSADGLVSFHSMGGSDYRFSLPGDSTQETLDYVQALAEDTAGVWCGQARLCLAGMEEAQNGLVVTFQYSLNGAAVALSEDRTAARFVVRNGAVTDFTLYLRSYTATEEISMVLPEALAAAAMDSLDARGRELELLYQDSGTDRVVAGWFAA